MQTAGVIVIVGNSNRFIERVRSAIADGNVGRDRISEPWISESDESVRKRVSSILADAELAWETMFENLYPVAETVGWHVSRVSGPEDILVYIESLVVKAKAKRIVTTNQKAVSEINFSHLSGHLGLSVTEVNNSGKIAPSDLRSRAIDADIGITGVEYAITETGTCVLSADDETGRLVGLAPPIHVALVKKGQVIPTLDDLFAIRKLQFLDESFPAYTNLISGPSRSADIEYTLVTGVHGPGEVHMLLIE
tara:strand:+ start:588 stop:1340 length:753 start_codon:yes stop_codon:yes gene_type:complete